MHFCCFADAAYVADRNFPPYYNYYYYPTNDYLFNFTCDSDNVTDCMYDFTDGDNCSNYNGNVVLACYIGEHSKRENSNLLNHDCRCCYILFTVSLSIMFALIISEEPSWLSYFI